MTLDELKNHPSFPFANFLDNDLEFLLLELYWIEFFKYCLPEGENPENWKPIWPANRDGNHILWLGDYNSLRAIRILIDINEEKLPYSIWSTGPTEDENGVSSLSEEEWDRQTELEDNHFLPIDWWTEMLPDEYGDNIFHGFTISVEMSPKALRIAEKMLKLFLRLDYTEAEKRLRHWNRQLGVLVCQHTYDGIDPERDYPDDQL